MKKYPLWLKSIITLIVLIDLIGFVGISYEGYPAFKERLIIISNYLYQTARLQFQLPQHLETKYATAESLPTTDTPIPKIIHFIWLGSKELPEDVQKTIATWKKFAPDFEIKRWDESNCDIHANEFIEQAYHKKQYDFASDWCRFKALEAEGGLYLDTDHILTKPLKLPNSEVVVVMEDDQILSASFVAAIPHHPLLKQMLQPHVWTIESFNLGIASPNKLTDEFLKYFTHLRLPSNNFYSPQATIYTPNVYMLDYGGDENRGIHYFGSGATTYSQHSRWYNYFFASNLIWMYTHWNDKILIPLNETEAYDYLTKEVFFTQRCNDEILAIRKNNVDPWTYNYCRFNSCYLLYSWRDLF